MHPHQESPINAIPPVALVLFFMIIGIDLAFTAGAKGILGGSQGVGWRIGAIQSYGFSSEIFQWMINNWRFPPEHMMRFATFPFVHGNFTSALFAGIMVLALGKFVGEVFAQWAVLVVFFVSGIVGAVVHGFVMQAQPWLIGAFPGVYGLIGAFTFSLWVSLANTGGPQARAFTLIGFLMGIQLVFGLLFGSDSMWLAEFTGFATGFVMSFILTPGGWARIRAKLRHS